MSELAMNAPEPVFAMFRLRPVVEYVPALPRPQEELEANNKLFLGMVAKHLMKDGGVNPKFVKDEAAHGKAVAALMTELMTFDDTKTKPYLHGFEIGIALEARMGGGSARSDDGSYKSGDGWGWSAQKPFQTSDGAGQAYVNVTIPGFWTETVPSPAQACRAPSINVSLPAPLGPTTRTSRPGPSVPCRGFLRGRGSTELTPRACPSARLCARPAAPPQCAPGSGRRACRPRSRRDHRARLPGPASW